MKKKEILDALEKEGYEPTDKELEELEDWLNHHFRPSDETMEKFKKDLREFLKLEKKDVKYVPVKRLYKDFDYPEREREAKEDQEIRELFEERRPKRQKLKFKSKRKNKSTRKKSKAKSKARRKKSRR